MQNTNNACEVTEVSTGNGQKPAVIARGAPQLI